LIDFCEFPAVGVPPCMNRTDVNFIVIPRQGFTSITQYLRGSSPSPPHSSYTILNPQTLFWLFQFRHVTPSQNEHTIQRYMTSTKTNLQTLATIVWPTDAYVNWEIIYINRKPAHGAQNVREVGWDFRFSRFQIWTWQHRGIWRRETSVYFHDTIL
jgi:hypothetical protein